MWLTDSTKLWIVFSLKVQQWSAVLCGQVWYTCTSWHEATMMTLCVAYGKHLPPYMEANDLHVQVQVYKQCSSSMDFQFPHPGSLQVLVCTWGLPGYGNWKTMKDEQPIWLLSCCVHSKVQQRYSNGPSQVLWELTNPNGGTTVMCQWFVVMHPISNFIDMFLVGLREHTCNLIWGEGDTPNSIS